jgi:hypothetical protein
MASACHQTARCMPLTTAIANAPTTYGSTTDNSAILYRYAAAHTASALAAQLAGIVTVTGSEHTAGVCAAVHCQGFAQRHHPAESRVLLAAYVTSCSQSQRGHRPWIATTTWPASSRAHRRAGMEPCKA